MRLVYAALAAMAVMVGGCSAGDGLPAQSVVSSLSVGEECDAWNRCASGICAFDPILKKDVCAPAPTCANSMKDGLESDIDCGGAACLPCMNGHACVTSKDCVQKNCAGNWCGGPPDDMLESRDASAPPDLAASQDLATPSDLTVLPDLAVLPDLTVPPDLAIAPDLAVFPDLAASQDLATPSDLTVLPDLAVVSDLAQAVDGGADDMAAPLPRNLDLGQACVIGSQCKTWSCQQGVCGTANMVWVADRALFAPYCPQANTWQVYAFDWMGRPLTGDLNRALIIPTDARWGPHMLYTFFCGGVLFGGTQLKPAFGLHAGQIGIGVLRDGADISDLPQPQVGAQICVDNLGGGGEQYKGCVPKQGEPKPCP